MGEGLKTLDCTGRSTREINTFVKEVARTGPDAELALLHPDSRHNLVVGVTTPLRVHLEGHVGYYCAGLCENVDVRIRGDAGWGLAENLMSGRVHLTGSAGSATGATMR
ncbi:MAG: protein glxC, partial [Janthinobacterium lividum]